LGFGHKRSERVWALSLLPGLNRWTTPGWCGWPHVRSTTVTLAQMPLWAPFVLTGLPGAYLWWRDRLPIRAGCCRKCGYDLTGNVSGRCPECGTAV
jgi:hypothetical protein